MNGGEVFEFCLWLKMHFYFILGMFLNVVFRCTYKMYVFQVSNTPWIEMHSYVLSHTSAGVMSEVCEEEGRLSFHFQKSFHVSPFMDMDHKYNFAFTDLGENAICDITMCKGADLYFDSKVSQSHSLIDVFTRVPRTLFHLLIIALFQLLLNRYPFTLSSLCRMLLTMPAYTLIIQLWIHWQALLVFIKGTYHVKFSACQLFFHLLPPFCG